MSQGSAVRRRHPDIEIASIAVKGGFVTKAQAKEALREVKVRAREGRARVSFLRILLNGRIIASDRLVQLARETERHTYICDRCERRCVLAPSRKRDYSCPRCGAGIETAATSEASLRHLLDPERELPEPPGIKRLLRSNKPLFGRYRIIEELGRGAMGVVYRARHVELKKDVALKLLLAGVGATAAHVSRFRREAAAVARLDHPNIVRVLDFGAEDDLHFLAMELIEGGRSLHLELKKEEAPLDLRQRLELVVSVARAMSHAHATGIIHRDLKPANILLTLEGVPKVCDFGLAKDFEEDDELTQPEARVGTPLFLAPELIHRGSTNVDARADVWALGVMVFLSVTGRYPFRAKTVMELYIQVLQEEPDWDGDRIGGLVASQDAELTARLRQPFVPASEDFPDDLRLVCEKALAKPPALRYQSADELADELERFLNDEAVLVRAPSAAERLLRYLRRRQSSLVLVAGGVMIALTLLALLVSQQSASDRESVASSQRDAQAEGSWGEAVSGPLAFSQAGFDKARLRLQTALDLAPGHGLTALYRGLVGTYSGLDRAALSDLEAAATVPKLARRAARGLALGALFSGDYGRVFELLEGGAGDGASAEPVVGLPSASVLLCWAAMQRRAAGDLEALEARLSAGAMSDPEHLALRGMALWLGCFDDFRAGQGESFPSKTLQAALGHVRRAAELRASVETELATALIEQLLPESDLKAKRVEIARLQSAYVGRLRELRPLASYQLERGRVLEKQGDFEEAARFYGRAAQLSAWLSAARAARGRSLARRGRVRLATVAFDEALRLNPGDKAVEDRRRELLLRACDGEGLSYAERSFAEEELWKRSSGSRHLRDRGTILFSMAMAPADLDRARLVLEEARRRSSSDSLAVFALHRIAEQQGAAAASRLGKLELARERAEARPEGLMRAYVGFARAEFLRGEFEAASRAAARALGGERPIKKSVARVLEARARVIAALSALAASKIEPSAALAELSACVDLGGFSSYELVRLTVLEPHRARPEYLELKAKLERSEGRGD